MVDMTARAIFEVLEREGWGRLVQWVADGEQESQHLEAKCAQMDEGPGKLSGKTAADIAKAVSGLANAEGGVVIVGVDAQKPPDGGDDRIWRTVPIPGLPAFTRAVGERLHQLVEPQVPGMRVLPIPDPADADRGALAVYVPLSDGGPFRTGRSLFGAKGSTKDVSERYYFRNGPNTNVMGHALLGLMFGRRPAPHLMLIMKASRQGAHLWRLDTIIQNVGRGGAREMTLWVERSDVWTHTDGGSSVWNAFVNDPHPAGAGGTTYIWSAGASLHPQQSVAVYTALATFTPPKARPATAPVRGRLHTEGAAPLSFEIDVPLSADPFVAMLPESTGKPPP